MHSELNLDYLCVDEFLRTLLDARALKSALELGVIDHVAKGGWVPADDAGLRLLIRLLAANGAVEERDGALRLTDRFAHALQYRELLEAKLDFASIAAMDALERFNDFVVEPGRFLRESRMMELFDYGRCFEPTEENLRLTRRWVRLTTALTAHEAGVLLALHDVRRHERMLDIGGNSGELARQACRVNDRLRASVADLPVVCRIGQEHLRDAPEAERIDFVPGDALVGGLPGGMDLVTFKSMLHDWPEEAVRQLMRRADGCLRPGGTMLIFERGPIEVGATTPPFSLLPMIAFFRSFRGPGLYAQLLEAMGYDEIEVRHVQLETGFFVVKAKKRG